jgi:hypothetical protein
LRMPVRWERTAPMVCHTGIEWLSWLRTVRLTHPVVPSGHTRVVGGTGRAPAGRHAALPEVAGLPVHPEAARQAGLPGRRDQAGTAGCRPGPGARVVRNLTVVT